MDILRASPDDVTDLVGLNHAIQAQHVRGAPELYRSPTDEELHGLVRSTLERADAEVWIGRDGGAAVGFLVLVVREVDSPLLVRMRSLTVDQISVEPEHHGRGFGRALMDHAEARASALDCALIELNVAAFNEHAQAFYEHLGFRPRLQRLWRPVGSGR